MRQRSACTIWSLAAFLALAIVPGSSTAGAAPLPSLSDARTRVELHLAPGARNRPHLLLLTLGGPIYCVQLAGLARRLDASLLCPDYARNGYEGVGERAGRLEDWGDPAYLSDVARLPGRLRDQGVEISGLVLVGVSYSGYANAELVATHPELRPSALVVVDSYLDLPARYDALPAHHATRTEMEKALDGTLANVPKVYAARSPSSHLGGLARAVRDGMKLAVVWSTAASEQREFRGATCSLDANARWLSELAGLLGHPVVGYVTRMRHAHALWDRGRDLLALVGVGSPDKGFPARRVLFLPGRPAPPGSYCQPG